MNERATRWRDEVAGCIFADVRAVVAVLCQCGIGLLTGPDSNKGRGYPVSMETPRFHCTMRETGLRVVRLQHEKCIHICTRGMWNGGKQRYGTDTDVEGLV